MTSHHLPVDRARPERAGGRAERGRGPRGVRELWNRYGGEHRARERLDLRRVPFREGHRAACFDVMKFAADFSRRSRIVIRRTFLRALVRGLLGGLFALAPSLDLLLFHGGGLEHGQTPCHAGLMAAGPASPVAQPQGAGRPDQPEPWQESHRHGPHACVWAALAAHALAPIAGPPCTLHAAVLRSPAVAVFAALIPGRTATGLAPPV